MNENNVWQHIVRLLMLVAVCTGCTFSFVTLAAGWQLYRTNHIRASIEKLDGRVYWNESILTVASGAGRRIQLKKLTKVWYRFLPSIAAVSITDRGLSDADLQVLSTLTSVQRLEVHSDMASDDVLATISRLPRLKHLTIFGKSFSATGFLQLRDAQSLERVEFDARPFSPIELAVLQMEISGLEAWQPASRRSLNRVNQRRNIASAVTVEMSAPALL